MLEIQTLMNKALHFFMKNQNLILNAFVATFLTVFGGDITKLFRKFVKNKNFILRYLFYILLCAVGFPILALILKKLLLSLSFTLSPLHYMLAILLFFLIVAISADRRKEM